MKRISLIILAVAGGDCVSCQKINIEPDNPVIPQGEVTREFLSRIRVGKDGRFQYWNQDSQVLKELKEFVAIVTDPNCKGYVPPQDRVATFDVDGTLMCEMINSENYDYLPGEDVWRGDFMQPSTAVNKIIKMRRELGNPEKAAKCKADCDKNGWIPVSMRDEWWTIYGPQVKRN